MTYTVKFRGHTPPVSIEDRDGESLGLLLLQLKKPDYVEINGNTVRTSEITGVTRNRMTEADMPRMPEDRQLAMGPHCDAQFSIQAEITKLAQQNSGKKSDDNPEGLVWGKLVGDKLWRLMMYQKLRAIPDMAWCDDKLKECSCTPEYQHDPTRGIRIRDGLIQASF